MSKKKSLEHSKGYKILLLKFYFDKGYGITSYLKYLLAGIGFFVKDLNQIIIFGLIYAVLCFIIGFLWCSNRLAEIENDIANKFNPFVTEMLSNYKKGKV